MMGNEKETYLKMVSIWSITSIPDLKINLVGDKFVVSCQFGFIANMDSKLFYEIEPIEVVSLIEKAFEKQFGVSGLKYRNALQGFKKNPFSSQN